MASVLLAAALPESILAGDAEAYRERMAHMFSGLLPYFEFNFEHLPGAIVPMATAWLLGGNESLQVFAFALAAVSTLLIVVTGVLLVDLEQQLGGGLAIRWAVALVPLLPFLLFRNDSLPVLLVVLAFWLAIRSDDGWRGTVVAWIAVATKLWPGAWTVLEWWRGRRLRALITLFLSVAALLVLRTRAVLAIQRPIGVHTETLAGSVLGLFRSLRGLPVEVHQTSSLYIEAEWWAHLFNALPAAGVAIASLTILRRRFLWADAWLLFGALTGSLILASPLFSTQYMAWITPFASSRRRSWALLVVANLLSLVIILTWHEGLSGAGSWFFLVLIRNLVLLVLLTLMVFDLDPPLSSSQQLSHPMKSESF